MHYIPTTLTNKRQQTTMSTTLAQRLRFQRKKKSLTQQALADLAGTTQDVIQKIENGRSLRPRIIEKLAEVLETSPAWLQFGIEELDNLDEDSVETALEISELSNEQKAAIKAMITAFQKANKPNQ